MERGVAHVALFAALIAALGVVPPITLGFGVPITAQTLGVMLAGAALGARRGAAAATLFVVLVLMGLPLLSGGRGGLGVLAGPTVGFFLGMIPAAAVTGFCVERLPMRNAGLAAGLGAFIGGVVVLYAFGIVGMSIVLERSLSEAFVLSLAFIPGDMLKAAITGLLVAALVKTRPQAIAWNRANRPHGG
ncbi:MAG: biotin transporter BioY [Paracoccus sp. (in: a-proteobacteria)]|uniref:biotin transporter BioY n=1 Tax=Paracoccus sp. TaxID=267 RepID=UPI002E8C643A|nr:biotin transporter BioY [Pseudomonadota bacterium]